MPFYNDLRPAKDFEKRDFFRVFPDMSADEKQRCIEGILRIKNTVKSEIPPRKTETNLLLASWNLKEFGHTTQRLPEAYFYIAEMLNAFDLIAIQEIKSSLKDIDIILRLLGSKWRYLVTDITDGTDGNREQPAYLYNTSRVELSGLAGEISLWDDLTEDSPLGIKQLKRSPFTTGFKSGWKKFTLINLHLHPSDDDEDVAYRAEEIRLLLKAIEHKRKRTESGFENLVILGDMNLYRGLDDGSIEHLSNQGFVECDGLQGKDTNASMTEAYDRMFFSVNDFFRICVKPDGKQSGGVFNPFEKVYRDEDFTKYTDNMLEHYGGEKDLANDDEQRFKYYKHPWRKNQISDHYPIWVELEIDNSESFLQRNLENIS